MFLTTLAPYRGRRFDIAQSERNGDPYMALQRHMNRLFDETMRDFRVPAMSYAADALSPDIDVRETAKTFEVVAELPGVEEKDVDVTLADGLLTIKGEKKAVREEKEEGYYFRERTFGTFSRTIEVPFAAEPNQVTAKFDKGVLTVTLPKPPEVAAKAKKIEVKVTH